MKILHLLSQCPDFTGSGIYVQNVMSQAAEKGHQNFLIAGVPLENQIVPSGIERENCLFVTFSGGDLPYPVPGMSDVMPYQSSRFHELGSSEIEKYTNAFTRRISEAVTKWQPDIIHSHHLWLMSAAAREVAPHLPMVTTCHSTDLRQFTNCPHLRNKVQDPCLRIDRVMSLGKEQSKKIAQLYGVDPARIAITGGGFRAELFSPGKKSSAPPVQLVYAGKLSRAKGVPWLLQAMKRVEHLPVHLHLVGQGTGPEDLECRRLAEKLKCAVTLHGRVKQNVLADLMGKSHLFVLPSFFEGMPLVLLEALASGCRVIATDLPGCRELLQGVDKELGELVELPPLQSVDSPFPEDMEKLTVELSVVLAGKIDEALAAPCLKNELISGLIKRHTWPAVFARIEKAYFEAQSARGSR